MNNLAILTTIFNHSSDSETYKYNFNIFLNFIKECNLEENLHVCEILHDGQKPMDNEGLFHKYTIFNNSPIWHKECGINYLLKNLDSKYCYVIVMDNDIVMNDHNWHFKLMNLLQDYLMVQPFKLIKYLGINNIGIDKYYHSFTYNLQNRIFDNEGNPGAIVAYNRSYLNYMDGLFDKCVVGGGDLINMIPFFYDIYPLPFYIFDTVFSDHKCEILDYINKGKTFIKNSKLKPSAYLEDIEAIHHYHGFVKHRNYADRYNLINQLDSINYIKKNTSGFYELIENSLEYSLRKDLEYFFINRQQTYSYKQPLIYNSNKYNIDGNSLWLSDKNYINFRNIIKVRIHFLKTHKIQYAYFIFNGMPIDSGFMNESDEPILELNNPKSLIIDSDFFIPKDIGMNNDIRKLSFLIKKIEISTHDNLDYQEYRLQDIL